MKQEEKEKKIVRLDKYLTYKGLSDYQVVKDTGIGGGTLSGARTGRNDVSVRTIDKIVRRYGDVSRDWLISGQGEMLVGEPVAIDGVAILRAEVDALRAEVAALRAEVHALRSIRA